MASVSPLDVQVRVFDSKLDSEISAFLTDLARAKPQNDIAAMVYRWAARLDADNADAHFGLARTAIMEKQWNNAIGDFNAAESLGCEASALYVNRGTCWLALELFEMSLSDYRRAIEIDPGNVNAYLGMFSCYQQMGDDRRSLVTVDCGLNAVPGDAQLLFCLATVQLMHGDYAQGWKNYEFRPTHLQLREHMNEYPEWDGSPLNGRRLLICREQGLGDEIMWARYTQALMAVGAHVSYYGYPALARLFKGYGMPECQTTHDVDIDDFDVWIGSGSLPLKCSQTYNENFSSQSAYFYPEAKDVRRMAAYVPHDGNLRIGLNWSGNPQHPRDQLRSCKFSDLDPIFNVQGCTFYSIQNGPASRDIDDRVIDLNCYCHDVADTAAAIANLDLVVTIDSMPAHLCGAIGAQCLVILGKCHDWRWGAKEQNDWYSIVRCVRGGGDGILGAIRNAAVELERIIRARGSFKATVSTIADPTRPAQSNLILTQDCRYGRMSFYRNDHYIGRSLALYSEYSQGEADLFHELLKPGDTVIEAGANIGALTLALADAVGETGEVLAFEPVREYYSLLLENTKALPHVFAFEEALGDDPGITDLRAADMSRISSPSWITFSGEAYCVSKTTIDSAGVEACHLIKVDVDGEEQMVLNGAERTIAKFRPLIYCEFDKPDCYPDLIHWLMDRKYRIYMHKPRLFSPSNFAGNKTNVFGNIVSAMLLCVPMERYDLRLDTIGVPLERVRLERKVV